MDWRCLAARGMSPQKRSRAFAEGLRAGDFRAALIAVLFVACSAASAQGLQTDLGIQVAQTLSALARKTGHTLGDVSMEGNEIEVTGDGRVSIGLRRLRSLTQSLSAPQRDAAVTFIVAHEFWHHWQLRQYEVNLPQIAPKRRQLLECQADMLAFHEAATKIRSQDIHALYGNFRELLAKLPGESNHDHLSANVRTRILATALALVATRLPAGGETRTERLRRNALEFTKVRSDEMLHEWSLRRCEMITNYSEAVVSTISMSRATAIPVRGGKGLATFELGYVNDGERPVILRGLLGDVASDRWMSRTLPVKYHLFEIRMVPGAHVTVDGVAAWTEEAVERFSSIIDTQVRSGTLGALLQAELESDPGCKRPMMREAGSLGFDILNLMFGLAEERAKGFSAVRTRSKDEGEFFAVPHEIPQIKELRLYPASYNRLALYVYPRQQSPQNLEKYRELVLSWCRAAGATIDESDEELKIEAFSRWMSLRLYKGYTVDKQNTVAMKLTRRDEPDDSNRKRCVSGIPDGLNGWEGTVAMLVTQAAADASSEFASFKIGAQVDMVDESISYKVFEFEPKYRVSISGGYTSAARIWASLGQMGFTAAKEVFNQAHTTIEDACKDNPQRVRRKRAERAEAIHVGNFADSVSLWVEWETDGFGTHTISLRLRGELQ